MTDRSHPTSVEAGAGSQLLDRLLMAGVVASTGAAVMVLELLGTRVIGPFYGVSLYVWSSLIAVTLFALALGYFVGGWCADRLSWLRLSHVVLLAAIGTALIVPCSGPVLHATDHLGLGPGALASAAILFAPALTCLGMVGPFAIKRVARRLEGVGTASGTIYAVSTLGSVVATLLIGFFLLSRFGTRSILLWTAGALFVLALAIAVYERRALRTAQLVAMGIVACAALGLLALQAGRTRESPPGFVVHSDAESIYGWVRVVDDERRGIRLLLSDASSIAAVSIDGRRTMLAYQEFLDLLPMLAGEPPARNPRRALLVGLGGGHVASVLKASGMITDTIEIDPAVADAARSAFGFQPTGAFIVGDGRYEIRKLTGRYELVILDCFTGGAEPLHLMTRETFAELKRLLTDDGVLAINFVGFIRGEGSQAVAAVAATLRDVFRHGRTFVTLPGQDFTDFVFLAADRTITFAPANDAGRGIVQLLERHEIEPPAIGALVLTDDFNPLERMQTRKTALYRTLFLERVAPDLLVR